MNCSHKKNITALVYCIHYEYYSTCTVNTNFTDLNTMITGINITLNIVV